MKNLKVTVSLKGGLFNTNKEEVVLEGKQAVELYAKLIDQMKSTVKGINQAVAVEQKHNFSASQGVGASSEKTTDSAKIDIKEPTDNIANAMSIAFRKALMSAKPQKVSILKPQPDPSKEALIHKKCNCGYHIWSKGNQGSIVQCPSCSASYTIGELTKVEYNCLSCGSYRGVFWTDEPINVTVCRGCKAPRALSYDKISMTYTDKK